MERGHSCGRCLLHRTSLVVAPEPHRQSNCFGLQNRYSINSSTRTQIDGGGVRPSALAVLAFKAISNLTGS